MFDFNESVLNFDDTIIEFDKELEFTDEEGLGENTIIYSPSSKTFFLKHFDEKEEEWKMDMMEIDKVPDWIKLTVNEQ